jgi:hypothetical protein
MFKVSEFAEKAGVTVRTLHHYDRLGCSSPAVGPRLDIGCVPTVTLLANRISCLKRRRREIM